MENSLTSKQNYINKEIINNGYNIESFNQYLRSLKGDNGHDLTLWTLYDLEQAVLQFRKNSNLNENSSNINSLYSSSATISNFMSIEEEIKCLGPEETPFSLESSLQVQLSL